MSAHHQGNKVNDLGNYVIILNIVYSDIRVSRECREANVSRLCQVRNGLYYPAYCTRRGSRYDMEYKIWWYCKEERCYYCKLYTKSTFISCLTCMKAE